MARPNTGGKPGRAGKDLTMLKTPSNLVRSATAPLPRVNGSDQPKNGG